MAVSTPTRSEAPASILPGSVLIVDDDAFMRDYLSDLLETIGVRNVRTANDGGDALRQLRSGGSQADVIVCDLQMPGQDGFLLMGQLAEQAYAGRVIVVSGMDTRTLNSATLMGRFHGLRFAGALSKPVQQSALRDALLGMTP